jgi:hypothetical protein
MLAFIEVVETAYVVPLLAPMSPASEPRVRAGVYKAPVALMVVVPVAPKAAVLALRFVVEAFAMLNWLGMESVTAPVAAEAVIWFAVPVMDETPLLTELVATQVGTPPERART